MRAMEAGLIEHWKKWGNGAPLNLDMCKLTDNNSHSDKKLRPIKLIELSSAFLVLGIGYALAILTFLLERIIRSFK